MKQTVPPVYANGNIYSPRPLPVPVAGGPAPSGGPPPPDLPILPPGPPIYHDPGPGPYPWPGNGHGVPNPWGAGGPPTWPLSSLLAGHYPIHDFYTPYDPHRTPQAMQLEALLKLLAGYGA